MDVVPEEIEAQRFTLVKRGFSPDEVTAYLQALAQGIRDSDDFRRAGTEVSTALRDLHDTVTKIRVDAERDAEQVRSSAAKESEETLSSANQRAQAILAAAEQQASKLTEDVTTEAEQVRREAEEAAKERSTAADADRALAKQVLEQARSRATAITNEAGSRAEERIEAILKTRREQLHALQRSVESATETLVAVRASIDEALERAGELPVAPRPGEPIDLTKERRSSADTRPGSDTRSGADSRPGSDDGPGSDDPIRRVIGDAVHGVIQQRQESAPDPSRQRSF